GEDPIGRRVALGGKQGHGVDDQWGTIVGVVGNVREFSLEKEASEQLYLSIFQDTRNGGRLFVRTRSDPRALVGPIRGIFRDRDDRQPVGAIRTLEEARSDSLAPKRVTTFLVGIFALLALVITTAGIVGVVSYSVSQRTQEIGVRMALGADRGKVIGMVLKQALAPVAVGLAAGLTGALALTKVIGGFLFRIEPTD